MDGCLNCYNGPCWSHDRSRLLCFIWDELTFLWLGIADHPASNGYAQPQPAAQRAALAPQMPLAAL
jgi:hypothetical protein